MNEMYVHGFVDAISMVLLELQEVESLEELRERLEIMLGLAIECKIDIIARKLGYPLYERRAKKDRRIRPH